MMTLNNYYIVQSKCIVIAVMRSVYTFQNNTQESLATTVITAIKTHIGMPMFSTQFSILRNMQ